MYFDSCHANVGNAFDEAKFAFAANKFLFHFFGNLRRER